MTRRSYPTWECFPPFGDRGAHAYVRNPEDETEAVSLCGRRSIVLSDHDPRAHYVRVPGKKGAQPDLSDTSGCCAACVNVADRRGLLPFWGKWESETNRKRRRRIARERTRRTL
jgi:hypothetical protein